MAEAAAPHILVVDDDLELCQVIVDTLRNNGYNAVYVQTAEEGLAAATENPPDLILSDLEVPVMGGFVFCQKLHANPVTKGIPFIFITVRDSNFDKQTAMSLGANHYMTKPFRRSHLLGQVKKLLEESGGNDWIGPSKSHLKKIEVEEQDHQAPLIDEPANNPLQDLEEMRQTILQVQQTETDSKEQQKQDSAEIENVEELSQEPEVASEPEAEIETELEPEIEPEVQPEAEAEVEPEPEPEQKLFVKPAPPERRGALLGRPPVRILNTGKLTQKQLPKLDELVDSSSDLEQETQNIEQSDLKQQEQTLSQQDEESLKQDSPAIPLTQKEIEAELAKDMQEIVEDSSLDKKIESVPTFDKTSELEFDETDTLEIEKPSESEPEKTEYQPQDLSSDQPETKRQIPAHLIKPKVVMPGSRPPVKPSAPLKPQAAPAALPKPIAPKPPAAALPKPPVAPVAPKPAGAPILKPGMASTAKVSPTAASKVPLPPTAKVPPAAVAKPGAPKPLLPSKPGAAKPLVGSPAAKIAAVKPVAPTGVKKDFIAEIKAVGIKQYLKTHKWVLYSLIGGCIAINAIVGWSVYSSYKEKIELVKKSKLSAEIQEISVNVLEIQPAPFQDVLTAVGTIAGGSEVELRFQTEGNIRSLNCKEGDAVSSGQVIATLDQSQTKIKLDRAKSEFFRYEKLYALGGVSKERVDEARTQYEYAQSELNKTVLRASQSGIFGDKGVEVGEFVTSQKKVGTLVSLNSVLVRVGVIEKEIDKIFPGQVVTATVDTYPNVEFKGKVENISPLVQGQSKTLTVEARIPNDNKMLLPGMFARTKIVVYELVSAIFVPNDALEKTQQGNVVYVVGQNNKAEVRSVEIEYLSMTHAVIKSGLNPGDQVIVQRPQELKEGVTVKVVEVEKAGGMMGGATGGADSGAQAYGGGAE